MYLKYTEDFIDSTWKGIVVLAILGIFAMDTVDSEMVVNDEENGCKFEIPGKKPGYTRDLWG